ncbi:hypothetical protein T07_12023 [Trichinella nelsoni]|uniref:Uncharacterized protein n=1 Tax=Trichinella nelsoni TaxID=6336 RepID=A0A0V0SE40_9BILA|nr:hypothetical protein T07_12023 [Trichinella nelsoni]
MDLNVSLNFKLIKCVLLKEKICQTLKNALINVSNGMHFVTAPCFIQQEEKAIWQSYVTS